MKRRRLQTPSVTILTNDVDRFVGSLPIEIGHLPSRPLRQDAKDYHQPIITKLVKEGKLRPTDLPAGRQYLCRLMVNFIRHNVVNENSSKDRWYRGLLEGATDRVGFHEAYRLINTRVLDAIAETFPALADECEAQKYEEHYLVEPEDIFRKFSTTGGW